VVGYFFLLDATGRKLIRITTKRYTPHLIHTRLSLNDI